MDLEDPIVKRIAQCLLVALMFVLLYVAGLCAWIVFDWDGNSNNSELLVRAIQILPSLSGQKTGDIQNIGAILISSLPVMVAPICFTTVDAKRRLNLFGSVMISVMLIALMLSVIGYMGINLNWGSGHTLGQDGLLHTQQWARAVLTVCVFYIAALLGLKVKS